MKILITGATGFVGSHLSDYLVQQGETVHGTFIYEHELDTLPAHVRQQITLHRCDLTEMAQVRQVVQTVQPDRIYHLAAIASVHKSWEGRELVLRVNLFGWLNLVEAIRESCPQTRTLMISSSEVYGNVPAAQQPISEACPFNPLSPYAFSKAAQELLCAQYLRAYQMPIVLVRAFNHTGPRQAPNFVCADFARQIAEIEKGRREPVMSVGNLDARRDFSDVRDIVRAYHLALEQCPAGQPFNVASGRAVPVQSVLDTLLTFSTAPIEVRRDPERMRPSDVPLVLGDATRLQHHTGWRPEIGLDETLRRVLDYWRQQLSG